MKSFITALCIGVFMITGCVLYMFRVEAISKKLVKLNDETVNMIEQDDYEQAQAALTKVFKYLESNTVMLAATGNHEELDQMQIFISQLFEYISEQHKGDALAHCKALKVMFEHLPKDYRIKAENIL